jgi:hypothetical protein
MITVMIFKHPITHDLMALKYMTPSMRLLNVQSIDIYGAEQLDIKIENY